MNPFRSALIFGISWGSLLFALEWVGFNKFDPSLVGGHKDFVRIWWHWPVAVGLAAAVRFFWARNQATSQEGH